ncbi:hypothetical protein Mapa_002747 [Marchantia paleacea]|nr:hypothetical protein Mapa_002747 [Marchantia paleacea]
MAPSVQTNAIIVILLAVVFAAASTSAHRCTTTDSSPPTADARSAVEMFKARKTRDCCDRSFCYGFHDHCTVVARSGQALVKVCGRNICTSPKCSPCSDVVSALEKILENCQRIFRGVIGVSRVEGSKSVGGVKYFITSAS